MQYKHLNAVALKGGKLLTIPCDPRYKMQEKFKGIRAFMFVKKEGSYLYTRGGYYVERNFPHLAGFQGNYVLDGELWQEGVEDEVVAGWANSKYMTPGASKGVVFQCFDIVEFMGESIVESLVLEERDVYRHAAIKSLAAESIIEVPYLEDPNVDYFAEIVARGGEGVMYKNMEADYPQRDGDNRPVGFWFKQKSVETFDVVPTGTTWAKPGKFEGWIGAIAYGMYVDGILLPLGNCSGMTNSVRQAITYEGIPAPVMEVKAAGQDPSSGALIEPRFIRWRYDKPKEDCIWYKKTRQ